MAVNLTPNILLLKPTDTELAKNWVQTPNLQAQNNAAFKNNANPTFQSYTPVLRAASVNPSLGAGVATGEFYTWRGWVFGSFKIPFLDPGVSAGTGEYAVSLPTDVDQTFHWVGTSFTSNLGELSIIGEGYAYDSSALTQSGNFVLDVIRVGGVAQVRMAPDVYTTPTKTSRYITNAVPFVPVTGDGYVGNFMYKAA